MRATLAILLLCVACGTSGGLESFDVPSDVALGSDVPVEVSLDVPPPAADVSVADEVLDDAAPEDASDAETIDVTVVRPGIVGVLRREDGVPMANFDIVGCMTTACLFTATDAEGRFEFPLEGPRAVAVKTFEDLDVGTRLGAALAPVFLDGADAVVTLGDVWVPVLPPGVTLSGAPTEPRSVAAGDGLTLTLRRSALTHPLFEPIKALAARSIPPERRAALPGIPTGDVVMAWALSPFSVVSAEPIGVSAPSGLDAGTDVAFLTPDSIDGHLSAPAFGRATGGAVETLPGQGITKLTHLYMVKRSDTTEWLWDEQPSE